MTLTDAQWSAIEHVARHAQGRKQEALGVQAHVCRMCDVPAEAWRGALANIRQHARVGVHFHPDRPCASGATVAQGLLADGRYRNQYETRISNGGLTAFPGGRRDACEQRLFGGAYHRSGVSHAERPKYGALELLSRPEGPSPRFGSCYLVLGPHVARRCTFTYLDSHEEPASWGTHEELDDILAALLTEAFTRDGALGERELTVPSLIRRLRTELGPVRQTPAAAPTRNLNHYVEAQVHGDIDLRTDVEAIVADPSFAASGVGATLSELSQRFGVALKWHHGFRLSPAEVPSDFRGRACRRSRCASRVVTGWTPPPSVMPSARSTRTRTPGALAAAAMT